jgi:hypothetical protein
MKAALGFLVMAILVACGTSREIEVDFVSAELIKIDTVYRYPNHYQQLLTWRSAESNLQYVSYTPLSNVYSVGSRMLVMVRR